MPYQGTVGCNSQRFSIYLRIIRKKLRKVKKNLHLIFSRNIVVFVVLLFYQPMIDQFGLPKVFWTHAVIMFLGNIFVFFVMPETRGLTMTQLNEIFGGKVSYEDSREYDAESKDGVEEPLRRTMDWARKTSSAANIAASKAAASVALSKVASAAAMSRVASLARSVGGVNKGN